MDTKTCTKCGQTKPLSEFNVHKTCSQGVAPECKACKKLWHQENYRKNGDVIRAKEREKYHTDPAVQAQKNKASVKNRRLRQLGWTPEHYDSAYESQRGKCKICGKFCKNLCADHDHETDTTRDLLCKECNAALGLFHDSSFILTTALYYLIRHS